MRSGKIKRRVIIVLFEIFVVTSVCMESQVPLKPHMSLLRTVWSLCEKLKSIWYPTCDTISWTNSTQVIGFFQILEDNVQINWNIRIYIILLIVPIYMVGMVKNMKYLVPFSAMANILLFVGLVLTFRFTLTDLPPVTERPFSASLFTLPLFFATVLFGMEGIGTVSSALLHFCILFICNHRVYSDSWKLTISIYKLTKLHLVVHIPTKLFLIKIPQHLSYRLNITVSTFNLFIFRYIVIEKALL